MCFYYLDAAWPNSVETSPSPKALLPNRLLSGPLLFVRQGRNPGGKSNSETLHLPRLWIFESTQGWQCANSFKHFFPLIKLKEWTYPALATAPPRNAFTWKWPIITFSNFHQFTTQCSFLWKAPFNTMSWLKLSWRIYSLCKQSSVPGKRG